MDGQTFSSLKKKTFSTLNNVDDNDDDDLANICLALETPKKNINIFLVINKI